jgi:uncharacterized protein with von Willebrand factor type A (vWA) domain
MENQFQNEVLRLSDNEPMVLACSALCDFLWGDFVRDTSPRVNYLIDRYDIRKLSRFGKELFEHLYQGDNITPLVSIEEAEDYFRAKQNGDNPPFPANYKPENAFWTGLMTDIVSSPAFASIAPRCVGDQFNSGNNAVLILNKLSEVIDIQIEQKQIDPSVLGEMSDQLENIRKQYVEAKLAGDDQKATELRQKGKALGQKIEEAMHQAREQIRPQVQQAMDRADSESSQMEEAMADLAGDQDGKGEHADLKSKRDLANKLKNNRKLLMLAKRLGAMRRAWNNRKRARRSQSNYSDIVGAKFSDSVINAFPAEIALAATEEGKALFALKYAQKTILTKDYEAPSKELDRGPVVMYVDISGSMAGEYEIWSKAIALVIAEEALKQNRKVSIVLFDNKIQERVELDPVDRNHAELLDFVATWQTRGGTSFVNVLLDAMYHKNIDDKADILMITDGNAEIDERHIRKISMWKDEKKIEWNSFCLGTKSKNLKLISDSVQLVDVDDDAASSDLFQEVLM